MHDKRPSRRFTDRSAWVSVRKAAYGVLAVVALYVIASSMDLADAIDMDTARKEQAARNIVLSMPLDCSAWVIQSGPGMAPKARCYSRKTQ